MFLKAALFMHNIMQIRSQNLFDFGGVPSYRYKF